MSSPPSASAGPAAARPAKARADKADERGHRRPRPRPLVGVGEVAVHGEHQVAVGDELRQAGLVGDQGAHQTGVGRDERQGVDGAAAAGEQVDRPGVQRRDDPPDVVGVLLGAGLGGMVGMPAPAAPRGS